MNRKEFITNIALAGTKGATVISESLAEGFEPLINVEHSLHILEIIEAARKSQETGMRIQLASGFPFPVVK